MQEVKVYAAPFPFSNAQVTAHTLPGSTIEDMLDNVLPKHIPRSGLDFKVFISGVEVSPEFYHVVKPKAGTVVNINVVPQGGRGKNPLAMVLSIALLVAAPYLAGAYATTLAGAMGVMGPLTVGQFAFYSGVINIGVGIIGRLAIAALAPPPKPSNSGSANNPAESPTQFIEGANNALNPYGVVPVCLGTNRMFPLQAARPFTETQNDDNYVRHLFTYGYGQQVVISDLQIGETDITEFTDIDMEHRLSGDLHEGTGLFANDVFQDEYGVTLVATDDYTIRTTQANVDEAVVDLTFPRGLTAFNKKGGRTNRTVEVDISYAPTGTGDWSPGGLSYKDIAGASLTINPAVGGNNVIIVSGNQRRVSYRRDMVVINKLTGAISVVEGTGYAGTPTEATTALVPSNNIRLATVLVRTLGAGGFDSEQTNIESVSDDRDPSLFGNIFETSSDFLATNPSGVTISVAAGAIQVTGFQVTDARTEALRRSVRIVFPTRGTYDIRLKRLTVDATSDQILDIVALTAIKSYIYRPPVNLQGINGTAMRIKATDQLNGSVNQFNVVCSLILPDYDVGTDTWIDRVSSNPASLYRYVLQGGANFKAVGDDKVDIETLQEWHQYCELKGYTYNRVIDYETSVDEVLRDIASAGAASPDRIDGKRSVVIDRAKDDIIQIVTPRNSWGYNGEFNYPEIPHALRVNFRNAAKDFAQDERIVYNDGYNESNATIFEVLDLQSCTNAALAFSTARRHLATAILRKEIHSFYMDVENLTARRGQRIKLAHDVPKIGVGDGRIKEVFTDGNSPEFVTGFTIDDTIGIPNSSTYFVRIRRSDNTFLYTEIDTSIGEASSFNFITPVPIEDTPAPGDLCYFVEAGMELDLIITKIEPGEDFTAKITALDYAPGIFNAENATIPPFKSNITTPLEFIRPVAPILVDIQSDEAVMLRNSDGSVLPRMVVTLTNENDGAVTPVVKVRRTGATAFTHANILEANPDRVVIAGLSDGARYDFEIRYMRSNSSMYSAPLTINSYRFLGASGIPAAVQNFTITVSDNTALLKWAANEELDIDFYRIKFSSSLEDATWATAQVLEAAVYENRLVTPLQVGTYLIKAVDILGNESATATAIITSSLGVIKNVVEVLEESPDFLGFKDNVVKIGNNIALQDNTIDGYYYFEDTIDLGSVYTSKLSAIVEAFGAFTNDIMSVDDAMALDDWFGSASTLDILSEPDAIAVADWFGIGEGAWEVQLQYRVTNEDPDDSPGGWGEWSEFVAGDLEFRAIQFRILMRSLQNNVTPKIRELIISIDMPDRIERGEDLLVPVEGVEVEYSTPFKNNPAVSILLQNADAADEIQIDPKTSSGFTLKVYNAVSATYVSRTFDFIASGYGRET